RDSLEAEAIVDALLVALADHMQLREHAAGGLELARTQPLGGHDPALLVFVYRDALGAEVAIEAALAILQRVGARESVLAQKAEQIDLAPKLVLAFDLVDPGQELSLGGLKQVIGVDRALADS